MFLAGVFEEQPKTQDMIHEITRNKEEHFV